jgi:large subunit ribosomal protein L15
MSNILNNIAKLKTNKRKRLGRGIGSGTGKTSGRGVKGQKARSGVAIKGFEGGQTPLYMRLPKKGFKSRCLDKYEVVNLRNVLSLIESKKIDGASVITKEKLFNAGLISNKDAKVKLIMTKSENVQSNLSFQVDFYSKQAQSLAGK